MQDPFIHLFPSKARRGKKATLELSALYTLLTHLGARSAPDGASRAGDEFFPRRILQFFCFVCSKNSG